MRSTIDLLRSNYNVTNTSNQNKYTNLDLEINENEVLNNKKTRILEVSFYNPYSKKGAGVENYVLKLKDFFEAEEFEVNFAYLASDEDKPHVERDGDIRVESKFINAFPSLSRLSYNILLYLKLRKNSDRYEVIHINGDNGAMLSLLKNKFTVMTIHGSWIDSTLKTIKFSKFFNGIYWLANSIILGGLEALAVKKSKMVLSVSQQAALLFRRSKIKDPILVIHPFIKDTSTNFENRDTVREKFQLKNEELLCLWVGKDPIRKGLSTAIEAVLKTSSTRLIVVGSNINLKNDRIINLGVVDDDTLKDLYAASDIFIFPSLSEGFSLAIVEAMAAGLVPLIRFDNPGTEAVQHGYNGFVARNDQDFIDILKDIEAGNYDLGELERNAILTSLDLKKEFNQQMHKIGEEIESVIRVKNK